jgi:5-methylthioadenosine/S-adenosylhomocysteine deaminase
MTDTRMITAAHRCLTLCGLALVAISCSAQSPSLIVRNATIMTMAEGQRAPIAGYLSVAADGTILAVAAGEPPASLHAAKVVDAHGDYIIPGFISAHSHLYQAAFRGLGEDQTLHGWIAALSKQSNHSSAEDDYSFDLYGALDHLEHGITSVFDFARGGGGANDPDDTHQKAQFRAKADSGMRFIHAYGIGRIAAPDKVAPDVSLAQARTRLKAFLDWTAAQPPSSHFLSVMISGSTAFNTTYQQPAVEAALMKEFHLGNETHFLEPPDDQGDQRSKFRWILDSGLLTHDLIFGHFIHTDDFILQQTAKAGASMSWQPLSNGRLASGVADIPKYLKMGVRVGMGVDGEASADLADPFENMRTGLYAIRDKYEDAGIMSPYQVLWLHTMGSADVLNIKDKVGSLEPGKFADFLLINPARLGVALEDPYANLVFVAAEQDIDSVYVGGDLQVDHGKMLHHDLSKVAAEAYRRALATATSPAPASNPPATPR